MEFTQSGDVLAGRYQLTDLLSESREGRFWRAQDAVLGRPVAVHVLDARDERAPRLMAAARNSAAVGDPRMLRVLDAAQTDQVAYVVNEWGEGSSLENALAAGGPLPPQQAAWIASEVADLLVLAHDQGHAHGRLNPEAGLLDDLGAVGIMGFGVDAALHGIDPDTRDSQRRDRVDAVGVLYAALTGKWAGETLSSMPPAPRDRRLPPPADYRLPTDDDLARMVAELRGGASPGDDIWIFGYGSLIWNPAFAFQERRIAKLRGRRRAFCLGWDIWFRGCEDRPGLMLALDRGGQCVGVAFKLPRDAHEENLMSLLRREVHILPHPFPARWVAVETRKDPSAR
jgi:serine/threonine protein kinase